MEYVVYKITCNSPNIDHLYVGSTENLERRTRKHTTNSNLGTLTFKLYNTIRDNGGIDNWKLEVIESGTVETRFEIKSRERFWYDQLRANLNMIRPQASKEEIRLDKLETMRQYKSQNKEKIKENNRLYRLKNMDKIKQYQLQYGSQKVQCEACCCEFRKGDKFHHNKTKKHLNNLQMMSNAQ